MLKPYKFVIPNPPEADEVRNPSSLEFVSSCSVIPTGAARSSPTRRIVARRAAQRGLCVPRASPGWRDHGKT